MNIDCPICRNDFDLRVQHEMHRGFEPEGKKGGEVRLEKEKNDQEELFERQY